MSESSTEVVQPEAANLPELRALYDPAMDFQRLALEAQYFSRGFRLVYKDELIGVPHVIISVTYREGYTSEDKKVVGDYVSIEAVVADKATMNSAQVRSQLEGELTVYPNEAVVYNDGGTGIRRALTELFDQIGLIDVGAPKGDENRFDKPYSLWADGADAAQYGITADTNGEKFRYVAMRGLRKSDYDSPYGPATTFYIG